MPGSMSFPQHDNNNDRNNLLNDLRNTPTYDIPSYQESSRDMILSHLLYSPMLSAQDYKQLAQYFPEYAELARTEAATDRNALMKQIADLAPQMQDVRNAAQGPETTALRDTLMRQIMAELNMGTQLTPEQERDATQYLRSAEMARGFSPGQGSANREAVRKALEGMKLLERRQSKASGFLQQENAANTGYNPFVTVGGMPTTSGTTGLAMTQQGTSDPSMSFLGQNYWNTQSLYQQQLQNMTQRDMYNAAIQLQLMNPNMWTVYK